MGAVGGTKQYPGDSLFTAGEYDHVFDVELGDGVMRKLPFNNGGNHLESAEKFCMREGINRT
jgi:phospholipase A-2-activating protein